MRFKMYCFAILLLQLLKIYIYSECECSYQVFKHQDLNILYVCLFVSLLVCLKKTIIYLTKQDVPYLHKMRQYDNIIYSFSDKKNKFIEPR